MKTQAHFSGIREVIIHRLSEAKVDVLVAVAWLTDRTLFDSLVTCQRRGVSVSLAVLDDHINRESSIAWEKLTALGGHLYWIPEGTTRAGSLHHKFCLIDNDTVINGSFNWTYRASSADENIIIIQGDTDFAEQFQRAFMHLLDKHGHDTVPVEIDRTKLLSCLTVITKLLELKDYEDLPAQINKLDHAKSLPEIADLIAQLTHEDWPSAKAQVDSLLVRGFAVAFYIDPQIEEYRWQIRLFTEQVMALETELADMHRQVHLFDHQQEKAIGDLIRQLLDLKRRHLHQLHKEIGSDETRLKAEDADEIYRQYNEARATHGNEPEPIALDKSQHDELKQLFRKLSMKCHPDRIKEEDKERATDFFQRMKMAYENNDLAALQAFMLQIETGGFANDTLVLDSVEHLKKRLTALQNSLVEINKQLSAVAKSRIWQTLSTHPDWNAWFDQQAAILRKEIAEYERNLELAKLKDAA